MPDMSTINCSKIDRISVSYTNQSSRFVFETASTNESNRFRRQYSLMYQARMRALAPRIIAAAKAQFGTKYPIYHLSDLQLNTDHDCIVIGSIIKRQVLRPSVLRELADDIGVLPQPITLGRLASDTDYLEVEDEKQIVRICMQDNSVDYTRQLATGVIVGLIGRQTKSDLFSVFDIIYPEMCPTIPRPDMDYDCYIMFVSGFTFTGRDGNDGRTLISLALLQKWICGEMGCDDSAIVSRVCRLIVAGESIAITPEERNFSEKARYLTRRETSPSVECVRNVDRFLARLTPLIPVDLMPGNGDPTNHMLPQRPMHRCIFPQASRHGAMLNLVSNPYSADVNGVRLLGTSGQNLADLIRHSIDQVGIELLESTLRYQHLCPTAPDTIDSFPFKDSDPFIIDESMPHIYFAGNQEQLESKIVKWKNGDSTLLLCIPRFQSTQTAVLVNLRNLHVTAQEFRLDHDENDVEMNNDDD